MKNLWIARDLEKNSLFKEVVKNCWPPVLDFVWLKGNMKEKYQRVSF